MSTIDDTMEINNNLAMTAKSNESFNKDNNSTNILKTDFTMIIGKSDKKKDIYIPGDSRYLNTLVIGLKNSGKTLNILPMMAYQDIKNKECGATYIVTKKEVAYTLYSMAKKEKRKVTLLKPSISSEISNKFLWKDKYSYDYINEHIINYKECIKNKEIVIIDMEILKYRNEAIKATAMLLLQLQIDMQETDITLRKPHFLYIDDSDMFLPYIEHILTSGDGFNIGTTLFIQSRNQLKCKDNNFISLIDNNVRNTILLNGLAIEDFDYYGKLFYEYNENNFLNRPYNSIIYGTIDSSGKRRNGICDLASLDKDFIESIEEKAKGYRRKLIKTLKLEEEGLIPPKAEVKVEKEPSQPINKLKEREKENKIKVISEFFNNLPAQQFISNTGFGDEY